MRNFQRREMYTMKRIGCSILTLLLVINLIPNIGWAANDDEIEEPRLYVTSKKTFTGDPGDSIKIPVKIKNNSDFDANNISVKAEIEGSTDVYIDGSGYDSISYIS